MSFLRNVLVLIAALVIASPIFAEDNNSTTGTTTDQTATQTTTVSSVTTTDSSATVTEAVKVDVNKASTKDLMKIKGINASKARAIIAYRKKHGAFKSTDDLMKVKGFSKINPDIMKQITEQVSVN